MIKPLKTNQTSAIINVSEYKKGRNIKMIVKHDIHNHTLYSLCCYDPAATVDAFARRAKELGHTSFGISNHLWDEKVDGASHWYHMQMINYGLEGARAAMPSLPGIRLMVGTETEYCGMSDNLGMLAETAKQFDYVLVPHTHIHMKNFVIPEMDDIKSKRSELAVKLASIMPELGVERADKLIDSVPEAEVAAMLGDRTYAVVAYNADFIYHSFLSLMANAEFKKLAHTVPTIVAHTFSPCGFTKDMQKRIIEAVTDDRYLECFSIAAEMGVGIEINTGAFKFRDNDFADEPMIRVMKLAKAAGCKFTFGTDAHSLAGLDKIRMADRITELCNINEDDVMEFVR